MVISGDRRHDVLMARFRTGCIATQKYLFRIKRSNTAICPCCRLSPETIFHLAFECPAHHQARRKMVSALSNLNIGLNLINLGLLLTGGGYEEKKRLKIMQIFINFFRDSKRTML